MRDELSLATALAKGRKSIITHKKLSGAKQERKLESCFGICYKIEETITNSQKQAEALRQSILKKAF
jgi:hypothetical protein